jgi:predicted permease
VTPRPPRLAQWIAARSLAPDERDHVLGDLAEEFADLGARRGRGAARRWYWRQALLSVPPNLHRRATRPRPRLIRPEGEGLMNGWTQDVRFAWRMIWRRPVVTAVAVASLVIGISLTATVFSLLNAVLLRPLPVHDPDSLAVMVSHRQTGVNASFSYPDFVAWRSGQRTLADLFALSWETLTMQHPAGSRVVATELVTGTYFATLGIPLTFGRGIGEDDDRPGAPPVAVVSESLWRDLGGEPDRFSARTITLNAVSFSIVGVVSPPFRGTEVGRDVRAWLPLRVRPALFGEDAIFTRSTTSWLTVMGRLAPGATLEAAAADLNAIERGIAGARPRPQVGELALLPGRLGDSSLPKTAGSPLMLLLGAAGLVLIIGCANVANLLLARALERGREIAVRTALGASRARLVRLVMCETVLLGAIGGGLGLAIAMWSGALLVPYLSLYGDPVTLDVTLDWRVLGFVCAIVLVTGVVSGLAPIFGVLRSSPSAVLAEGSRSSTSPGAAYIRRSLVVAQFALSLALVVTAALLARTVYNLRTLTTGFDIDRVALVTVNPEAARYDPPRAQAYFNDAMARLGAVPGVRAAGYGRIVPLGFGGSRMSITVPGYQPAGGEDMEINNNIVSPGYFEATGIRLAGGRAFTDGDRRGAPLVAIVNETMAARYWRGRNPVGARFHLGDETGPSVEVVGVAGDVKYRMMREAPRPSFYRPLAQTNALDGVIHVRTHGDPGAMLPTLRFALAAVDPAVPIITMRTLRDQATINVTDERLAMLIGVTLGIAALLLAAIGLYGAMSYTVSQRTRELGVRISLGASVGGIARLILRQAMSLSLAGAALGTGLAIALARLVESRLYGIAASDPPTIAVAIALLAAIALAASWIPARRASRIDPVHALRGE